MTQLVLFGFECSNFMTFLVMLCSVPAPPSPIPRLSDAVSIDYDYVYFAVYSIQIVSQNSTKNIRMVPWLVHAIFRDSYVIIPLWLNGIKHGYCSFCVTLRLVGLMQMVWILFSLFFPEHLLLITFILIYIDIIHIHTICWS